MHYFFIYFLYRLISSLISTGKNARKSTSYCYWILNSGRGVLERLIGLGVSVADSGNSP